MVSGCQTNSSAVSTTSERDTVEPTESGGGKPPWLRADSDTDIVVQNVTDAALSFTLETGETSTEVSVPADEFWTSGDIVPSGKETTVTLTTDTGLDAETTWEAEDANEQVLIHVITDEEIRKHTGQRTA
ncbi:hypothetical protein [Haloarchaeobius sp. DFWS5]|uniref:hypothetical protein n=1 Tax=Haloarchaeobius sp. DFWS5 TaxID=3446114 RepID=UPI003EBA5FDE